MDFDDSLNDRDRIIREHAGLAYKIILKRTCRYIDNTIWNKEDAFQDFVVCVCTGYASFCRSRREICESEEHARRHELMWVKTCALNGVRETRRAKAVCRVPRLIVERTPSYSAAMQTISLRGETPTIAAIAKLMSLPIKQVERVKAGQVYADVIGELMDIDITWHEDETKASDDFDERIEEIKATAKNVLTHEAYRIWCIHCLEPDSKRKAWHRCQVTRKAALKSVDESMRKIRAALTGQGEPCDPS